MTKKLARTLCLFALLDPGARAFAQNGPDNDANGAPGFTKSVFASGQVDSINLYNGQLTIPIPMGPSYPIGPSLRMQLALNYNSRVDGYGRPSTQSEFFYYKPLVGNPALGIGWEMTMGAIKPCRHGNLSGPCYFAPDGSQHMFDLGSKTGDGSQLFLKGTGPYDMWDGSGNHYEFDWQVAGFDDSATNYTHDFGVGRNGWYLTSVTDPFGNGYSVSYYSGISTPLWTYTSNGCGVAWPMQNPTVTNTWILKDIILPSGSKVHVNTAAVNGVNGMIKSVDFPELVDGTATTRTWTLGYDATFSYSRPCDSPNTVVANLQRLQQIQLPSDLTASPRYQFLYANGLLERITLPTTGSIEYCWGGYVFFHASSGSIQPGCPGLFPDPSDAVVTRSSACGLSTPEPVPSIPGGCTPDNSARWAEEQIGVVRRRENLGPAQNDTSYVQYAFPFGESGDDADPLPAQSLTVVISPPTDTATTGSPDAGRRRARAVLFNTATEGVVQGPADASVPGDRVGADLEERAFETDPTMGSIADPPCGGTTESNFCGSKAVRVTQRTYEYDATGGNRRLTREKTIYGASTCGSCPYHQVDMSPVGTADWENDGRHYATETHTGTLGGDARTITTDWAPVNWSTNPSNLPVLPNVLNQRTTTQGSSVRDEYFDFDTTASGPTGFLKGTFVYDAAKDIAFINCRYDDGDGNPDKDFTRTLGATSAPARTYCSDNYATFPTSVGTDGDLFGKDYSWQKGELLTARWINGAVGTSTFKFTDNTRDATTGWITSFRDTAGRQTSYKYDSLGRVNEITPPASGEYKTWVCYEGPNATTAYRASTRLACPVASNGAVATWQHFDYDGLGRLAREKRLQPGSAVVKRFTLFDGPGHAYFTSEWVTDATSEAVTTNLATACVFSGSNLTGRARPSAAPGTHSMCWDPFDRPQQIIGPKHSSLVTVDRTDGTGNIYSDTKDSVTTWCVNAAFADQQAGTCNTGAISPNPVTATKRDAFGRITSVTEPTLEATSYTYDVNGKLTSVTQGVQGRTFSYDTNGFLRSESTPERGSVTYDTIGSLGNVRQETQPGSLVISRTFDFAGRLTREDAPSGTKYVVNCYDGAAACVDGSTGFTGGSYAGGKLTRRYGYNWIPLIGPIVDEQFTYSDGGGRLSQLATTVGNGNLSSTTTQSWTYGTLGLVGTHNNSRVTGSFPVTYTYTNGLPTAISANSTNVVTAATYNPAAGIATWTAGNSGTAVITTITQDTSLLPRPSRIQAKKGSTTLFDTGTYSYDSAGNILGQSNATYGGSYTYDSRSRILSATYGASSKAFTYDRWGNLLSNSPLTFQMDTTLNNNHIKVGGSTNGVSYDPRGNLTAYNTESMFYDSEDRLYRNKNASGDYTFIHNGAGERVVKFPSGFTVLRREMARYIAEANIVARGWTLPLCDGSNPSPFADVSCSDPDARHIKLVYQQNITAGCGGTSYCPDTAITRAQMAVFMVKGYRGAGFVPQACPPAVNPFTDFTCSGTYAAFAPFIIQLYNDGVTAGCGTNTFCPGSSIGEWESLAWLAKGGAPGAPFWPTYHPVPRGSTYTLRDEQNRVATEIAGGLSGSSSATLTVTRDNVFLGSLLVASNAAGAWQYSASDHLGSPRAVWNASGTKIEDHKYWPYGEDTSATLNQHLAFQTMERNDAFPIYYDHARSQQYNLGRFVSPDQVGGRPRNPQSWNRYAYTRNNPLTNVDRNGLWTTSIHDEIVRNSFPGLTPAQQQVLMNSSRRMDSFVARNVAGSEFHFGQAMRNSFMHAMSAPYESRATAKADSERFVAQREGEARRLQTEAAGKGETTLSQGALAAFGDALHTVTDGTSPSHEGQQRWFLLNALGHGIGESVIGYQEMDRAVAASRNEFAKIFGEDALKAATACPPRQSCYQVPVDK